MIYDENNLLLGEIVVFSDGKCFDYEYDDDETPEDAKQRADEYVTWILTPKQKPILIYDKTRGGFLQPFEKYKEVVYQKIEIEKIEIEKIEKIEKIEERKRN